MSFLLQQYNNTQFKEVLGSLLVKEISCGGRKLDDLEFLLHPFRGCDRRETVVRTLLYYHFPPLTLHPQFNFRYRDIFKERY